MSESARNHIQIGLHAAVVAVEEKAPSVLTIEVANENGQRLIGLPFGPFDPPAHKTFETGLRTWVDEQTSARLGYVEQLYTFGDYGRLVLEKVAPHFVSVSYLALVRRHSHGRKPEAGWSNWYSFLPWEDWRDGTPKILDNTVFPALAEWLDESVSKEEREAKENRINLGFGKSPTTPRSTEWDEERVLERYELMYEAGLVTEAVNDGRIGECRVSGGAGIAMLHDHRRILATAIARLRGKLKYRPVVFELIPDQFTLTDLQQTVETLSGRLIHKQNFRRMVEKADLVESTGAMRSQTGGRPAALYRFRRSILSERPAPGLKFGTANRSS